MAYSSSFSSYQSSTDGTWAWRDSYRWVDFDAAASNEVDQQLTHFWTQTKDRNFSFPLTAGSYFGQQSNKDNYFCYVELNYGRNKINKIYQKNKSSSYQREMRRTPEFQLPNGNSKKMGQIFDKRYADKEEQDIMSEQGTLTFYKDVGVNPESHNTLIICYVLKCEELGIVSRDEFVNGLTNQGCNDQNDIKQCIKNKCQVINGQSKRWKEFYRWLFLLVREDDKKKSIPTDLAVHLWRILFQKDKHSLVLAAKWLEYCESAKDGDLRSVSRDLWEQIYDFLQETQSVDDYDDAGGSWPIAVDEFVEWLQENK